MSAYVKFVCDYCDETEIEINTEFLSWNSVESARSLLWECGWDSSDGYMCDVCARCNV